MPKAGIVCDLYKKKAFLDAFDNTDFSIEDCELPTQLKGKNLVGMYVHYINDYELKIISKIINDVEKSFRYDTEKPKDKRKS